MEEKIVITKRFRNNTLRVYQYLLKEFSAKTAYSFLGRLEKRIESIAKKPCDRQTLCQKKKCTQHFVYAA
jgi:hypothetical protein